MRRPPCPAKRHTDMYTRLIQNPLAIKILDGEVVQGDHVLLDADPLHNRLEIKVLARTEVNLG